LEYTSRNQYYIPFPPSQASSATKTSEEEDGYYLRHLFRGTNHDHGLITLYSSLAILMALRKMSPVPVQSSAKSALESVVYATMMEWRRYEESNAAANISSTITTSFNANNEPINTAAPSVNAPSNELSVYHSFATPSKQLVASDNNNATTPGNNSSSSRNETSAQRSSRAKKSYNQQRSSNAATTSMSTNCQRWTKLIQAIYDEECLLNRPLLLTTAAVPPFSSTSSAHHNDNAACVLIKRVGITSAIVITKLTTDTSSSNGHINYNVAQQQTQEQQQKKLLTEQVLLRINVNQIGTFQQQILNTCVSGSLLLNPSKTNDVVQKALSDLFSNNGMQSHSNNGSDISLSSAAIAAGAASSFLLQTFLPSILLTHTSRMYLAHFHLESFHQQIVSQTLLMFYSTNIIHDDSAMMNDENDDVTRNNEQNLQNSLSRLFEMTVLKYICLQPTVLESMMEETQHEYNNPISSNNSNTSIVLDLYSALISGYLAIESCTVLNKVLPNKFPRLHLRLLIPSLHYAKTIHNNNISSNNINHLNDAVAGMQRQKICVAQLLFQEVAFLCKNSKAGKNAATKDAEAVFEQLRDKAAQLYQSSHTMKESPTNAADAADLVAVIQYFQHNHLEGSQETVLDSINEEKETNALANVIQTILTNGQMQHQQQAASSLVFHNIANLPSVRTLLFPHLRRVKYDTKTFFQNLMLSNNSATLSFQLPHLQSLVQILESISHSISRLEFVERNCADHPLMFKCAMDAISIIRQYEDTIFSLVRNDISSNNDSSSEGKKNEQLMKEERINLHSAAFRHACKAELWDDALNACLDNPCPNRRIGDYKRLVLNIVECGHLDKLLALNFTVIQGDGDDRTHDGRGGIIDGGHIPLDLFEAAAAVLHQKASEQQQNSKNIAVNKISANSTDSTVKCDYRACLYSLYVSRGYWRKAALTMDDRYDVVTNHWNQTTLAANKTISNNNNQNNSLSIVAATKSAITESLSLSALSTANAILLIEKSSHQFLVSGERSSSQAFLTQWDKNKNNNDSTNDRLSRLRTCANLQKRASLASAWKILLASEDQNDSYTLPMQDQETIERLANAGYYERAISLAQIVTRASPNAKELFLQYLLLILCEYLAPMTEMNYIIDGSNGDSGGSSFMFKQSQTKSSMDLLERLTMQYSFQAGYSTLALEVARKLIQLRDGRANLPLWITNLLTYGNKRNKMQQQQPSRGIFAMHIPLNNIDDDGGGSGANPTALLRLYTEHGLYTQACELVTLGLIGEDGGDSIRVRALRRLPEKGDIDYIPYPQIDYLWSMIEKVSNVYDGEENDNDATTKDELLLTRAKMEKALQFHFEMVALSEQGRRSARASSS